ncbi:unnamed protein product [Brassica oleracea var. botrytis]
MKAIIHQQETAENTPEIATVWINEKDVCIFPAVKEGCCAVCQLRLHMEELAEKLRMQMPPLPCKKKD